MPARFRVSVGLSPDQRLQGLRLMLTLPPLSICTNLVLPTAIARRSEGWSLGLPRRRLARGSLGVDISPGAYLQEVGSMLGDAFGERLGESALKCSFLPASVRKSQR